MDFHSTLKLRSCPTHLKRSEVGQQVKHLLSVWVLLLPPKHLLDGHTAAASVGQEGMVAPALKVLAGNEKRWVSKHRDLSSGSDGAAA